MISRLLVILMLIGNTAAVAAQTRLAIIIDDVGNDYERAQEVLELPPEITVSILPRLGHSTRIAEQAHRQGREVMLHQPMQSMYHKPLGPGGLTLLHTRADIDAVLATNLRSVPHVVGINNHMGSLLTRELDSMRWLMTCFSKSGSKWLNRWTGMKNGSVFHPGCSASPITG